MEEAKAYPLEGGDWSSCDDSEDETVWDTATASYGFGPADRRRFTRVDAGRKRGAVGGAAAGSGSGASSPLDGALRG